MKWNGEDWVFAGVIRYYEIKACNCASCGEMILGAGQEMDKNIRKDLGLKKMGGRIHGRPYCMGCVNARKSKWDKRVVRVTWKGETSPAWENAIRAMEG